MPALLQTLLAKVNKHLHNLIELGLLGLPSQAWPARGGCEASRESSDTGGCPSGVTHFTHICCMFYFLQLCSLLLFCEDWKSIDRSLFLLQRILSTLT